MGDIEIAMTVIKDNQDMLLNTIDRHYNALDCEIEPMEKDEEEYEVCFSKTIPVDGTPAWEIISRDQANLQIKIIEAQARWWLLCRKNVYHEGSNPCFMWGISQCLHDKFLGENFPQNLIKSYTLYYCLDESLFGLETIFILYLY